MSKLSNKDKNSLIPPLEKMDHTPKLVLSNKSISKMAQLEEMAKSYDFPTPKWNLNTKRKKRPNTTSLFNSSILNETIIDDLDELDNQSVSTKSDDKKQKSETDFLSGIIIEPPARKDQSLSPIMITNKTPSPVPFSSLPSPSPTPPLPPEKPPPKRPKSTRASPPENFKPNNNKKKVIFTNFVFISGVVTTVIYIILRGQVTSLQTSTQNTNSNNNNNQKVSVPTQTTTKSSLAQSNLTNTTCSSVYFNCYKTCLTQSLINDSQWNSLFLNFSKKSFQILLVDLLSNNQTNLNVNNLILNETLILNMISMYKTNFNEIFLNNNNCYSTCNISSNANKLFNSNLFLILLFNFLRYLVFKFFE